MNQLFSKVDSIIIPNYKQYWVNPIINKYLPGAMDKYEGTLILRKNNKAVFISHPFNYTQAKKEYSKYAIIKNYNDGAEYKQLLREFCNKKIGFDGKYHSVNMLKCVKGFFKGKKVKWFNVAKDLAQSREIKEEIEIQNIRVAVHETNKVLAKAIKKLKKGISETDVERFINREFENDGFSTAFCIVAFGKNASNLHHVPSKTKLANNKCILFDVGCICNGYRSDISQSFWFGKKNEEYEKELFKIKVFLEKVKIKIKNGIKASELWEEVKELNMPHALGHGIGLEEHDFPSGIGEKSKWTLKEGMVLAIEVGEYKKFGIRVERDFLVTKNGFKEL